MSNSSAKKKIPLVLCILLWFLAFCAVATVCAFALWNHFTSPVSSEENAVTYKLRVPDGSSVRQVARELQEQGIIRSADVLYLAARFSLFNPAKKFNLKSGVYTLDSAMPLSMVYEQLQSGNQEYISVSIPEGLTISKIALLLEEANVCSAQSFKDAAHNVSLLAEYNIPAESFEGYLFPDTYFFTPQMEASAVVRRLADTFFKRVQSLEGETPLSAEQLHSVLTLASIVEREYRVASEAPLIASVFTNRLKNNIGLYSCATIEYILTEIEGLPHPDRITYADLAIDSPYNTYKWAGLPPGPISNPGMTALNAALHPADTSYYYFVLTDPETGSHTFSSTFDAHIAAENSTSYVSKQ